LSTTKYTKDAKEAKDYGRKNEPTRTSGNQAAFFNADAPCEKLSSSTANSFH
jgi:hypothetical protein